MTDSKPNLILIGLRASGKSTLGKLIAQMQDMKFIDLDDESSQLLGCIGAGEAIERYGINAFREAEAKALHTALQNTNTVISLGGGTPTAPGCSDVLRSSNHRVLYLRALPSTLQARLSSTDNTNRPALVGNDVVDEVQSLFDQRDELYSHIADNVLNTDSLDTQSTFDAIISALDASN